MSEKQAKEQRKQEPKIKAQLSFNLLSDGSVTVSGPIADPIAVVDILRAGFASLVPYWAKQKGNESRIVKANTLPPSFMLPQ